MKIALITSKDSVLHFFEPLKEKLMQSIAGCNVAVKIVESAIDIPKAVKECAKCDLVFVCYYYFREDYKVVVLANKLIEIETAMPIKMLKEIKQEDAEEDDTEIISEDERKAAEFWHSKIIEALFGKKPKKTSDEEEFSSAFPGGIRR